MDAIALDPGAAAEEAGGERGGLDYLNTIRLGGTLPGVTFLGSGTIRHFIASASRTAS